MTLRGVVDALRGDYAFLRTAAFRGQVFLHRGDVAMPWPPAVGQRLMFELRHTPRGPRAVDAAPVE